MGQQDLKEIRRKLDKKQLQREQAIEADTSLTGQLEEYQYNLVLLQESDRILKEVSGAIQIAVYQSVSKLVTKCIQTVFEEPDWEFHFECKESYGKVGTFYYLKKGNLILDDLLHTSGGGLVDCVSFALRVAAVMLKQPRVRRLLVLDEPFRFLSEAYRPNVAVLMQELSKELDIQFIMVTHFNEFYIGKVHRVK